MRFARVRLNQDHLLFVSDEATTAEKAEKEICERFGGEPFAVDEVLVFDNISPRLERALQAAMSDDHEVMVAVENLLLQAYTKWAAK